MGRPGRDRAGCKQTWRRRLVVGEAELLPGPGGGERPSERRAAGARPASRPAGRGMEVVGAGEEGEEPPKEARILGSELVESYTVRG